MIGANGAGKTTLFRLITGQETARHRDSIRIGDTVKLGYVDQSRDALEPEQSDLGGDFRRRGTDPARQA